MEKISEEERSNRIFIITSLIRENEKDHVRLEKELKELDEESFQKIHQREEGTIVVLIS